MAITSYLATFAQCSNCDYLMHFSKIQFEVGRLVSGRTGFEVEQDLDIDGNLPIEAFGRAIFEGFGKCPNCALVSEFLLEIIDSLIVGVTPAKKMKLHFAISATLQLVAGGRSGKIKSGYRCPMQIEGEYWDCHVIFNGRWIYPGETRSNVVIQFLSPEAASERLTTESIFYLTEGTKIVASGKVDDCYRP